MIKNTLFLIFILTLFNCTKNKDESLSKRNNTIDKVEKAILYANLLDMANITHNDLNNIPCMKKILGNYWTLKSTLKSTDTIYITLISNTHSYNEKDCLFLEYNSKVLEFYFIENDSSNSFFLNDSNVIFDTNIDSYKEIASHVMNKSFILNKKKYLSNQKVKYIIPLICRN